MRPDKNAQNILSTTRARAKMHEFRVPAEDFVALPRDPSLLFPLAVGLLGDVSAKVADQALHVATPQNLDPLAPPDTWQQTDPTSIEGLHFASTFFDAFLQARLDDEITPEFSLLCASAYYLSGASGSASVVARHMGPPPLNLAGGLARLVYSILRNEFLPIDGAHAHAERTRGILEALNRYVSFQGTAEAVTEACGRLHALLYGAGSPRELLYSDLAAAICGLKLRNAARTLLPLRSGLDEGLWRAALAKSHFPVELWPAQQLIGDEGLLTGRSAIIQMPTSAGKTRATELIIRSAFLSNRASLAVIVAPYRSLCHDIRGDLATAFAGEDVRLDEASDAYQFDLSLQTLLAQNSVLIVTPEKFLYMMRRAPELKERIGLVIYDEGHQFDGMARGPTYELLLTSLRITLRPGTQIVLISAVISNAADVAGWLLGDAAAVVQSEGLLPTSKSIAFTSWQDARGRLEYVSPQDPDEREFFVPRVIVQATLNPKPRERTVRVFPEKSDGGDVGLYLGLHVVANGSVAVFCGRKDSATKIARRAVDIFARGLELQTPSAVSDAAEVGRLRTLSEAHLGATASATQAAGLGIFVHHADTPHGLRLAIEHAMKANLAKFVVCTSTLAQGVNFPLKYLIVTSTRQGGEKLLVRDFHNLIGRAGRAGMHTEGSIIFSAPALYDQRHFFGAGRRAWLDAKNLLDASNSEPSRSSILSIFDDYQQRQLGAPPIVQEIPAEWLNLAFADRARMDEIVQAALELQPNISAGEFRSFIEGRARAVQAIAAFLVDNMTFGESEDIAAKVDGLTANTFAYHLADDAMKTRLLALFRAIAEAVQENTNDVQRLVIRRSPLSPSAVTELQDWMRDNIGLLQQAADTGRLLDSLAVAVLPYSTTKAIRAISNPLILPRVLAEWITGRSFAHILGLLVGADIRMGDNRITIEDVVSLCEGGFGYDVAMIVASLTDLAEGLDADVHSALARLQRQVKYGLSHSGAIAFFEAGFADRHVATVLGQAWPHVIDRDGVKTVCREHTETVNAVLAPMPSYFKAVAGELGS